MESNRWKGMMNVCFNYSGGEAIVFNSLYVGDGINTKQHNAFDEVRYCLPPPMCMPPADI